MVKFYLPPNYKAHLREDYRYLLVFLQCGYSDLIDGIYCAYSDLIDLIDGSGQARLG